MSENATRAWDTSWTAADPLRIGFAWRPAGEGEWAASQHGGFEARDLGLEEASGGKMGVSELRPSGEGVKESWVAHGTDFEFLYVLSGSITIEPEGGEPVRLGPDDTAYLPHMLRHRRGAVSDDFRAVEIVAPARFPVHADPPGGEAAGEPVFTFEGPGAYTMGDGPRKFFKYRNLGTRGPTEERIHLHVVRATGQPGEGTGWHYHSMAQWFMILGGSSHIRVEDGHDTELNRLDSMCIGSGPRMRHNVAPYTGDYAVLEMCVPAEYETVAVTAPEGAAPPPPGGTAE